MKCPHCNKNIKKVKVLYHITSKFETESEINKKLTDWDDIIHELVMSLPEDTAKYKQKDDDIEFKIVCPNCDEFIE